MSRQKLIIVDTNIIHDVLTRSKDHAFAGLHKYIVGSRRGHFRLSIGGTKFEAEMYCSEERRMILKQLDNVGLIYRVPSKAVDEDEARVGELPHLSDDEHILAIARVGSVRVLFSLDINLSKDFKNNDIISPRGKVYRSDRQIRRLLQ